MSKRITKGQQFLRFFIPVIEILRELGGSGTSAEVTDAVIEKLRIPEQEQKKTIKSGASRVKNQVAWARMYLVNTGFLDSSQRGIWSLTEKGLKANLAKIDVYECFREVQNRFRISAGKKGKTNLATDSPVNQDQLEESEKSVIESSDYKIELLNILRTLPAEGFERICQRLLREAGFAQVIVTGKTGDGGIDGHGILEVNPFVSFNVLFQCKRYQGTISPSKLRDFRGAMTGRTDKGIFLTTGSFTAEAKKEARRDGAPPIELVDGDKLVEMFEQLELGLIPKKTYEIDRKFFEDFQE